MENGLQIAAAFSYGCGRANYLGISSLLKKFIFSQEGKIEKEVRNSLKRLASYPYYKLIALASEIDDPFDLRVVKAHWIGNDLLEKISREHIKELIKDKSLREIGWTKELIVYSMPRLASDRFLAHHNFYAISELLKFPVLIEKGRNNCWIIGGKVVKAEKNELIIKCHSLIFDGEFRIGRVREEKIKRGFLRNVKAGDLIASHFGEARFIINGKDLENLIKYTQKILDALGAERE
ncbi:MAG: hypothetical protein COY82_02190 [Parcubacteria group bacterium CG_4_10_14_0_8_um_filter_35_7]|nr:MAG: hypothetical protein COX43_00075 [Parcubacteria group bacterium CG23_combo_of_CG06-09_8_20_14_all_35_9]PIY78492.1 MAG: hypothetical protein COY82_02190 [Parcubacteria group bacterium CG_4_10_14_0_8_um_filter_35_7]